MAWTLPLDCRLFQHFLLSTPSQEGPQEENLRTTEGVQLAAGKKGEDTPEPKSQPALPSLSLQPGSCRPGLLEPHPVTSVASVFLRGFIGDPQFLLLYAKKHLDAFLSS